MTLDEFFAGKDAPRRIFEIVRKTVEAVGPADIRVTKSQVAFCRQVGFAYVWMPDKYLRRGDVPLVLTLGLRRRDGSARWKEVVEPVPGRFTHHLELRDPAEIDDQVRSWIEEAWSLAGD